MNHFVLSRHPALSIKVSGSVLLSEQTVEIAEPKGAELTASVFPSFCSFNESICSLYQIVYMLIMLVTMCF